MTDEQQDGQPRLYLDNAATSWPKPEAVYRAVDDWQRRVGASYGRGESAAAGESAAIVARARRAVATVLGADDPSRVVFTAGGTDSLTLALRGWLRAGDHVVASVAEHNAVLRTLDALASRESPERIEVTWVGCDAIGVVDPDDYAEALRDDTSLAVVTHASNVTGVVQPVASIAERCKARGVPLLVDAAQTLGRWPTRVDELGATMVAAPGHKGLLGPLGAGVLWLAQGIEERLRPLRYGGAASGGSADALPATVPDRYEAGSLNLPGIAGLLAGTDHVLATGIDAIREAIQTRCDRLRVALSATPGVTVRSAPTEHNAGVVSFSVEGYDPHDVAMVLASAGIDTRAGLHCAPRLHDALATRAVGGLVRLSPGAETPLDRLDEVTQLVASLASASPTES